VARDAVTAETVTPTVTVSTVQMIGLAAKLGSSCVTAADRQLVLALAMMPPKDRAVALTAAASARR
jgi:hypothetical protein